MLDPTYRTANPSLTRTCQDTHAPYPPEPESSALYTRDWIGALKGRYEIGTKIGQGGMAEVFEGRHVELGHDVALKVLLPGPARHPERRARFRTEGQLLARLNGPRTVSVYDYVENVAGRPVLVMQRLRGTDLRMFLCEHGRLPAALACGLVADACQALAAAHHHRIVHCDVKPENLFLEFNETRLEGEMPRCSIIDFGVACLGRAESDLKESGLVGTLRYMAPEQVRSPALVDPRTDVFALGTVLYECLVGESPFADDKQEQTLSRIVNGIWVPLRARRPDLPLLLSAVIERAMATEPVERFSSVMELAHALYPWSEAAYDPLRAWQHVSPRFEPATDGRRTAAAALH